MKRRIKERFKKLIRAKIQQTVLQQDGQCPEVKISSVKPRKKGGGSSGVVFFTSLMDIVLKSPQGDIVDHIFDPVAKIADAMRIDQVCKVRSWGVESYGTIIETGRTLSELPRIKEGAKGHALIRYETESVSLASLISRERRRKHASQNLRGHMRVAGEYLAGKHERELIWHDTELLQLCKTPSIRNRLYNRYLLSQLGKINSEVYAEEGIPTYLGEKEWGEAEALTEKCFKEMHDHGERVSGINGDFSPANSRFKKVYFTADEPDKTAHFFVADTGSIQIGDAAHDVARMATHLIFPLITSKRPSFWKELLEAFLQGYLGKRADPGLVSAMSLPHWRMVLFLLNKGGGLVEVKDERARRLFALHGLEVLRRGEFFITQK